MASVSTDAITAGRAKHAGSCHEEWPLSPDGAGYAPILPLSGRARGTPQCCCGPTFRPALLGVGLSLVRQYGDIMMSGESDETNKAEEQPNMSLAATSAVCCGALFGAMVSGVEKLVEIDWGSKPFGLLAYILVVAAILFFTACVVFAFAFMKSKKNAANNASKGNTSAASAFQSAESVESADLNRGLGNRGLGSGQQDDLEQLNKKRLRSEIKMHKAVTRCAKEARWLIMVVVFWLFINAMNRSDH